MNRAVRLTKANPLTGSRTGAWFVILSGQYVGKVRQTDGQWCAAYWRVTSPVGREMTTLAGGWNRRDGAVSGVVGAWLADQADRAGSTVTR